MTLEEIRIREALAAHDRGWRIIPLAGKRPVMSGWQAAPRPDRETAESWAANGNYGIVTGESVVVLDVDDPELVERALSQYVTVAALTGKGVHLYFAAGDNPPGNAVGLWKGIDFRGRGGQVVGVGSVHPETRNIYRWAPGRSPDEATIAPLPDAVRDKISPPESEHWPAMPPETFTSQHVVKVAAQLRDIKEADDLERKYADIALTSECVQLASVQTGSRNHALNQAAFNLGQLVGSGLLDEALVRDKLFEACMANGLVKDDGAHSFNMTLASGLRAGIAHPRRPDPAKRHTQQGELKVVMPDGRVLVLFGAYQESPEEQAPIEAVDLASPHLASERPEFIVPNLIRREGMHLVWAQPGGYKTRMTMRVILELMTHNEGSTEPHFLCGNPSWPIRKRVGRTLILTTEEAAGELKYIMGTVAAGFGRQMVEVNRLIHVYAHQPGRDQLNVGDLPRLLDSYGPFDMVVLDSLTGLRPKSRGIKWDVDNDAASVMCLDLRQLISERSLCLWIIHHSDKLVQNYRGPTEWWASADVMFGLLGDHDKESDTKLIQVLPQKTRGGAVLPPSWIRPEWEERAGGLALHLEWFNKRKDGPSADSLRLYDVIVERSEPHKGVNIAVLPDLVGWPKTKVKKLVAELVQNNRLHVYEDPETLRTMAQALSERV